MIMHGPVASPSKYVATATPINAEIPPINPETNKTFLKLFTQACAATHGVISIDEIRIAPTTFSPAAIKNNVAAIITPCIIFVL